MERPAISHVGKIQEQFSSHHVKMLGYENWRPNACSPKPAVAVRTSLKKKKKKHCSTSVFILNIYVTHRYILLYKIRMEIVSQILGISQRSPGQQ